MKPSTLARILAVTAVVGVAGAGGYAVWRSASGPARAQASSSRVATRAETATVIAVTTEVYDVPFASEKDEQVSAVLGSAESGAARVIPAPESAAFREGLRSLTDCGRASLASSSRAAIMPRQPATIGIASRPAAAPSGTPATDRLTLALVADLEQDMVVRLDAKFRAERVTGQVATLLDQAGIPAGERAGASASPRLEPGDLLVMSRLMDDSRYIVVIKAEPTPGR